MGRRYSHSLNLVFQQGSELPKYAGEIYAPSIKEPDYVEIADGIIRFDFCRSSKLKCEDVLSNKTRLDQIRRSMLFVSAVAESIPRLESLDYFDGLESHALNQTESMALWHCGPNMPVVEISVASRVFQNEQVDKAIALALSYICASRRTLEIMSQSDRFRYLWSAFNSLYSYLSIDLENKREWKKLDCARSFMEAECDFTDLFERYGKVDKRAFLDQLNYHPFLKNRLVKSSGEVYGDWAGRIACMDKLLYTHARGALATIAEQFDQDIRIIESTFKSRHEDEKQQILFLVFDYAYKLRNSFFHGESYYPLFPVGQNETLAIIADLLEMCCIAIIKRLSFDEA